MAIELDTIITVALSFVIFIVALLIIKWLFDYVRWEVPGLCFTTK
jgi:hypothetical protein